MTTLNELPIFSVSKRHLKSHKDTEIDSYLFRSVVKANVLALYLSVWNEDLLKCSKQSISTIVNMYHPVINDWNFRSDFFKFFNPFPTNVPLM